MAGNALSARPLAGADPASVEARDVVGGGRAGGGARADRVGEGDAKVGARLLSAELEWLDEVIARIGTS